MSPLGIMAVYSVSNFCENTRRSCLHRLYLRINLTCVRFYIKLQFINDLFQLNWWKKQRFLLAQIFIQEWIRHIPVYRVYRVSILKLCIPRWQGSFMGPPWGPAGPCRPQKGPMLAPWTLLSGYILAGSFEVLKSQQEDRLYDVLSCIEKLGCDSENVSSFTSRQMTQLCQKTSMWLV